MGCANSVCRCPIPVTPTDRYDMILPKPGDSRVLSETIRVTGFPPVIGIQPRVLILGSMPGVASLTAQQYYAMPRNAFWPIMGELFGAGFEMAYAQRLELLMDYQIALWDVLGSCVRPGSLDASIEHHTVAANDFADLLANHTTVSNIFFNGKKAAEMFRRHVVPALDSAAAGICHTTLPSTSPAHATLSFDEKLAAWSIIRDVAKQE